MFSGTSKHKPLIKQKTMKKFKHKQDSPEIEMPTFQQITEDAGTKTGIQTMLRITSTNHIRLSEMADTKANILISVNAIIISVILSVLLPQLHSENYLTIPALIFLAVAVSTIVVAITAIKPKLNRGTFKLQDIEDKKINLLFFGNFHKMPLQNYDLAMRIMMRDPDYLYRSMIKDIYYLGVTLGKKYRLVRLAYNIFMVGLIVSIIAFSIAAFLV